MKITEPNTSFYLLVSEVIVTNPHSCFITVINPFMPSELFCLNSLDQFSSSSRGVWSVFIITMFYIKKKGKRKVQGVPQSQTAALPRPQEEAETDKSKQAQTEKTYEKH